MGKVGLEFLALNDSQKTCTDVAEDAVESSHIYNQGIIHTPEHDTVMHMP